MNILLCGASGFIGARIASALQARGHTVLRGVRDPAAHQARHPGLQFVKVDFQHDREAALWLPRLKNVDVVINAVGILREQGGQTFEALHIRGPLALFDACIMAGARRVIQISALGADARADTPYHLSKRAADDGLLARPLSGVVVQPSLVFGPSGASTRLLSTLAVMPCTPLPGDGEQRVQPVHLDDLAEAVVRLTEEHGHVGERIAAVGGQALSLRSYLAALRQALGLGEPRFVKIPKAFVRLAARLGGRWPGALLDTDSWRMLERGNTGDSSTMARLLARPPRTPDHFMSEADAATVLTMARLTWLLPVLRISLALVWLTAGIVSMGLYPIHDSLAMLARVGVGPARAPSMLYGAAVMDLILGVATLAWPRRRLWLAQAALVLSYTALITAFLPEQWLHPFGPVVKNLPFLAVLWLLYAFEERP